MTFYSLNDPGSFCSLRKTGSQTDIMGENIQYQDVNTIREYLKDQYNFSLEQIDAMLPNFLAALASHMDTLEQSLAENHPLQVGKAAHTIKGALLNLGLTHCAELARCLEEKGKQEQSAKDLKPLIVELRRIINDILG